MSSFLVTAIGIDTKKRIALCHEVSALGASLGCARAVTVGDLVELEFDASGEAPRTVSGTVVRCERNPHAEVSLWRYLLAIEFAQPDDGLEALARRRAPAFASQ